MQVYHAQPCVAIHVDGPGTQGTEAQGSSIEGQARLHHKSLSQKVKTKQTNKTNKTKNQIYNI